MNYHFTRHQILENLPAYTLGALEPEEMLAMDRYLQQNPDPELLTLLQKSEEATTLLAIAAPPAPLPASAKEKLMARVQASLPDRSTQKKDETPLSLSSVGTMNDKDASWTFSEWLKGLFSGAVRSLAWAAVGAFLVLLLLGGYLNQLRRDFTDLQNQITVFQDELKEAHNEIEFLQNQLKQAQAEIERLQNQTVNLQANNSGLQKINNNLQQRLDIYDQQLALLATSPHQVTLSGTDQAPTSSGTLFFGDSEGVLVLDGLPRLSEDETYQLWLIPAEGDPLSVGLVDASDEATKSQTISLPPNAQEYAAVGLSQEPAGGSPSPTLVVMLGLAN